MANDAREGQGPIGVRLLKPHLTPHRILIILMASVLLAQVGLAVSISRVVSQVSRLVASQQEQDDAGRALELSRAAAKSGDFDLAEVYLVNCISRTPGNAQNLTEYTQLVQKRPQLRPDDLDRLASVLELALYRIPPADVKPVHGLLADVHAKRAALKDDRSGSPPDELQSTSGDFERIKQSTPEVFDVSGIKTYLDELRALATGIDASDHALLKEVEEEQARFKERLEILNNCAYIDACFENLSAEKELASERAVSIVQSTENAMPVFWGRNLGGLPDSLNAKIKSYPAAVQSWVDKIAISKSEPALSKIRELKAKATMIKTAKHENEKHESRCKQIEKKIEESRRHLTQIRSSKSALEAQQDIDVMVEILRDERKTQFNDYQLAVLGKCEAVFRRFHNAWVVSESDARQWFKDENLAEIDQGLLSTEVARCLNNLLGKLLAEVGADVLLACEKEMGSAKKLKLEDF